MTVDQVRRMNPVLRMAVTAGVESAVRLHIERGDDLGSVDASGMTVLMLAAARNKPAICRLLVAAGVDCHQRDPSGRTALEVAEAAGAYGAVEILRAALAAQMPGHAATGLASSGHFESVGAVAAQPVAPAVGGPAICVQECQAPYPLFPALQTTLVELGSADGAKDDSLTQLELGDGVVVDLSAWEAEPEPIAPVADEAVLERAASLQQAISRHVPNDSSTDWEDVEAFLPEQSVPLVRSQDAEGRAQLRLLLLRALREGSVPQQDVEDLSLDVERAPDPEARDVLTRVVNDLGAEVDERFEYDGAGWNNFKVWTDPEESPDEEEALDQALGSVDIVAKRRNEPLRMYQREFQRLSLLTAEEETSLAQQMEAGVAAALDALSIWPTGLRHVLKCCEQVLNGKKAPSSLVQSSAEVEPDLAQVSDLAVDPDDALGAMQASDDDAGAALGDELGVPDIGPVVTRLRELVDSACADDAVALVAAVRASLSALRLSRRFLVELADLVDGAEARSAFCEAVSEYRTARDRMTVANLKLAFQLAKKGLYSGEPLDDLIQEANLGLLKAVDRFDWRRGYKFSTMATWWIRQSVSRHIADKARLIRIPVHMLERINKARRYLDGFGPEGTDLSRVQQIAKELEMTPHKLTAALRIAECPVDLDLVQTIDLMALGDQENLVEADPCDKAQLADVKRIVHALIAGLPRKEAQILRLRFGVGVFEPLTLEEVGQRLGVTRERVRQIEVKALKRLRLPSVLEMFKRSVPELCPTHSPVAGRAISEDEVNGQPAPDQSALEAEVSVAASQPACPSAMSGGEGSALDHLLKRALTLGIRVNDDREGLSGRVWVIPMDPLPSDHRRFIRDLHDFGFRLWPGRGYWR